MGKHNAIIMLGMPGSGKSTVGRAVAQLAACHYISTGTLARELLSDMPWMLNGDFAPESALRAAFESALKEAYADSDWVVIDGMPRKPEQVEYLHNLIDSPYYFKLHIPEQEAIARLLGRGRGDDVLPTINKRIRNYRRYTMKAEDLIPTMLILDGTRPVDMNALLILNDIRGYIGQ